MAKKIPTTGSKNTIQRPTVNAALAKLQNRAKAPPIRVASMKRSFPK